MGITEAIFGTKSRNQELGFRVEGSGRDLATDTTKLATKLSQGPDFRLPDLGRVSRGFPGNCLGPFSSDFLHPGRADSTPVPTRLRRVAHSNGFAVRPGIRTVVCLAALACRQRATRRSRVGTLPQANSAGDSVRKAPSPLSPRSGSLNFKFQISSFKPVLAALALLALCNSASADAAPARRNPFWPVGYAPKAAATQEVEAVAAPVLSDEELWLQTPVGAEEWEAALAALPKPGGLFIGLHPETREKVDKMVLMGRTFVPGQEFTTTNNAVAFTWKVDYISFNEKAYRLSRVLAERIPGGRAGRK